MLLDTIAIVFLPFFLVRWGVVWCVVLYRFYICLDMTKVIKVKHTIIQTYNHTHTHTLHSYNVVSACYFEDIH